MSFIGYGRQQIDDDDIQEVIKALKSDFLTTGPYVEAFENKIAEYTNNKYAVAVSNGTAALHIAALSIINAGDKVITTPNTFAATANSILYAGGVPIFADIAEDGNISIDSCEKLLAQHTDIKAVFSVNFSGRQVDKEQLKNLKDKYDLKILEDCAHSIGGYSIFNGNLSPSGSCDAADICIFSFHPVKNITCGEGGAVTTNSKAIADKLLMLRNHGITRDAEKFINQPEGSWHHEVQILGYNYRLSDINSALGLSQLKKLDKFMEIRRKIAEKYSNAFSKFPNIVKPLYPFDKTSAYHIFVLQVDFEKTGLTRQEFMIKMAEHGVGSQVHYIPAYRHPLYEKMGFIPKNCPTAEEYYKKCLTIPLYTSLSETEQENVISTILNLCGIC